MALQPGEAARKLVHVGVGGFALLLRWLSWPQAAALAIGAFLFNWQLLPRIGGRALWRSHEHGDGYPRGILIYPLSVLGLVLWFRGDLWMTAVAWTLLSVGDGLAGLAGQVFGGPRLPWNPRKGVVGLAVFVLAAAPAAALVAAWTLRLPLSAWWSPRILAVVLPVTLACALVESLDTTLDDNLTVPLVAAVLLPLLAAADWHGLLADPELTRRLGQGLMLNAVIAFLAQRAGSIDMPGALSAIVIGTAITAGSGLRGFALMLVFFVVGSAVTRAGYAIKLARGIAQERGGARGWRNAWANGGVPALLGLLAGAASGEHAALLLAAYAASVATAAADTCSSELGKAYGRRTFMLTTLRPVVPGTEGAVSLEGTLGGLAGAAAVASVGLALGLYGGTTAALVTVAGLLGSLAESVIGSVAERRGWLDNDQLNALNTAIGGGFGYALCLAFATP